MRNLSIQLWYNLLSFPYLTTHLPRPTTYPLLNIFTFLTTHFYLPTAGLPILISVPIVTTKPDLTTHFPLTTYAFLPTRACLCVTTHIWIYTHLPMRALLPYLCVTTQTKRLIRFALLYGNTVTKHRRLGSLLNESRKISPPGTLLE